MFVQCEYFVSSVSHSDGETGREGLRHRLVRKMHRGKYVFIFCKKVFLNYAFFINIGAYKTVYLGNTEYIKNRKLIFGQAKRTIAWIDYLF